MFALAAALVLLAAPAQTPVPAPPPAALAGTVSGSVQGVGFRALILKQAIRENLAGTAANRADGTVAFTLQGPPEGLGRAVAALRAGTPRSASVKVETKPAPPVPGLASFTVSAWTSLSRGIRTPYDLVHPLRQDGRRLGTREAARIYRALLERTLDPGDRARLARPGGDGD